MIFEEKRCPCGAAIIWASTAANKAMPVNAEIVPEGNVLLTVRPGREPLAAVLGPSALDVARYELRLSHFVTCPFAEKFRTKPPARGRKRREGQG
jgi:hypothetical protein